MTRILLRSLRSARRAALQVTWAGFAFLFVGASSSAHAQPPDTLWTRVHPLPEIAYFKPGGMVGMSDDGLYVCAAYDRLDETHSGLYLLRFDSLGNLLWHHPCLDSTVGVGNSAFCQLSTSRFLAVGTNTDGALLNMHAILVDDLGSALWARIYDLPGQQYGSNVCLAADGNPVLACKSYSVGNPTEKILLLKLDATNGDTLWTRSASIPDHRVWATGVIHTQDDGFAVVGYAGLLGQGGAVLLMKFDVQGQIEFYRLYHLANEDYGYDVAQCPDGSFVLCGATQSWPSGMTRGFALQVGSEGDSLWLWTTQDEDGSSSVDRVAVLHDLGFVLLHAGNHGQSVSGFNAENVRLWRSDINLPEPYTFNTVRCLTIDGQDRLSAVGRASDNIHGYPFVAVLRTEQVSLAAREGRDIGFAKDFKLSVFPNPFNSSTTLPFDLPSPTSVTVTVFDVTGREVMSRSLGRLSAGRHSQRIGGLELATGIYFARVSSGVSTRTVKMVMMR